MPEINLLSAAPRRQPISLVTITPFLVKLLTLLLILLAAYYGIAKFRISAAAKKAETLQLQISEKRGEVARDDQRNELLTRQSQLADLKKILQHHLYWSMFLNSDLPRVTLKVASYSAISAQSDGKVILVVSVPTYEDLDKFLQVFDLPKFNKDFNQFTDVEVKSITKAQQGNSLLTSFKIELKYNTAAITYSGLKKAAGQAAAVPGTNSPNNNKP